MHKNTELALMWGYQMHAKMTLKVFESIAITNSKGTNSLYI